MTDTSGGPSAKVLLASAGYLLVAAAGLAGILLAAPSGDGTPLASAWLGFAGVGGIGGAMLLSQRQVRQTVDRAGEVAESVKADTKALRNGELEAKIHTVISYQLALHTAEVDRRIDKRMLTIASDVADLVVERMAS